MIETSEGKNRVVTSLHGVDHPVRRPLIEQRNGYGGELIAKYFGIPYVQNPTDEDFADPASFTVHATTMDLDTAQQVFGITSESDFYGAAFSQLQHAYKNMLYPCASVERPGYYTGELAKAIDGYGLRLPGYVGFTKESIVQAYPLYDGISYNMRLIRANASDGEGQFSVENLGEVETVLNSIPDREVEEDGLIVVPDLREPTTYSVGYFRLGNDLFSFVSTQKDIYDEGYSNILNRNIPQTHFGGGKTTVVKGPIGNLRAVEVLLSAGETRAVEKGEVFIEQKYVPILHPLAPRLSVDFVEGKVNKTRNGEQVPYRGFRTEFFGGTDPTTRFGGHCVFLLMAAQELKNSDVLAVRGETTLNYSPSAYRYLPEEKGAKVFIDAPGFLRATARVNDVIRRGGGGTIFSR